MALLRPKNQRNRSGRPLPQYLTLACPRYGHRITWCRQICTPIGLRGECGRLAPHAMTSKTQAAIAAYNASRAATLPEPAR
ncbi:MAG: hypothetical protein MUC56_18090 [Thermoanaerobaculales bacterium]|jgi:hypothetical protein|nr:hypothetical protein [Thermoanaerobaculales bacterium]